MDAQTSLAARTTPHPRTLAHRHATAATAAASDAAAQTTALGIETDTQIDTQTDTQIDTQIDVTSRIDIDVGVEIDLLIDTGTEAIEIETDRGVMTDVEASAAVVRVVAGAAAGTDTGAGRTAETDTNEIVAVIMAGLATRAMSGDDAAGVVAGVARVGATAMGAARRVRGGRGVVVRCLRCLRRRVWIGRV